MFRKLILYFSDIFIFIIYVRPPNFSYALQEFKDLPLILDYLLFNFLII